MRHFSLFLVLLLPMLLPAQVVTVSPVFPQQTDTVTITFDASQGNGALDGVTPVYAHTGVITTASANANDWRHVQGNWGTADPNVLMTDVGNNKHEIKYHIESFYSVPGNESVTALAFVFRNQDGSIVGREADGSDIFYTVYLPGQLNAAFVTPAAENLVVNLNDNISVSGAASNSASLTLTDNGATVATATGTTLNHTLAVTSGGNHTVVFTADDGGTVVSDTFYYAVNPSVNFVSAPNGTEVGINYTSSSSARLYLYSPGKTFAYVLGDFNDYRPDTAYFMNRTPDNSAFWIDITGLTPGEEYTFQYFVDGEVKIADPFSELILDPNNDQFVPASVYPNMPDYPTGKTTGIVTVLSPGATPYTWTNNSFVPDNEEDLVIYELLMRDFVGTHHYQTLIDTLDYLDRLGINAIQLMPVNEFEGNISWGYNPSYHMALDKYYGTKDDLKAVVDACHSRGIAVILDVVYNHAFSQSPICQLWWDAANFRPAPDNPYLNVFATHPFNVGYDFNHQAFGTQTWVKRVMKYWLEEYKVDGFRFDLSKGFTQVNSGGDVGAWSAYDGSRIALLKDYFNFCRSVNPNSHLILEHLSDNSEETELSNYGYLMWGKLTDPYNEATMGYIGNSDLSWISYQQRGWAEPRVVGYMESHDEERLMYKNVTFGNVSGNYDITDTTTALARMELASALFYTIPGPKMLWQWGELGYDVSYDEPCPLCPKPILWNYYQEPARRRLYQVTRALINLKKTYSAFRTTNFQLNVGGTVKTVVLNDPNMNVVVAGNFGMNPQLPNVSFPQTGWWYEYFTGDSINVTGNSYVLTMDQGEYRLYTDEKLPLPDLTGIPTNVQEAVVHGDLPLLLWPNPSNGEASLRYRLESPAQLDIEVYDLSGRLVSTVFSGKQTTGEHVQQLDGSNWGAGRYVVRLRTADRSGWQIMEVK